MHNLHIIDTKLFDKWTLQLHDTKEQCLGYGLQN